MAEMAATENRSEVRMTTGRPKMPKDYGVPADDKGLLPWSHAQERLERSPVYWIVTARPDGRPHVSPVWGVWLDGMLYFDGSPETRRSRNLKANPFVAVHLESGGDGTDVVILAGEAREMGPPGRELASRVSAAYSAKYKANGYEPGPETWDQGGLYVVEPRSVIAWTQFPTTATRWAFERPG
jgi:nitroimidazol reductase NimA-like FMN-containing flavoprotein (pyridoxamine 5'-phosphate oxidase superfamily)